MRVAAGAVARARRAAAGGAADAGAGVLLSGAVAGIGAARSAALHRGRLAAARAGTLPAAADLPLLVRAQARGWAPRLSAERDRAGSLLRRDRGALADRSWAARPRVATTAGSSYPIRPHRRGPLPRRGPAGAGDGHRRGSGAPPSRGAAGLALGDRRAAPLSRPGCADDARRAADTLARRCVPGVCRAYGGARPAPGCSAPRYAFGAPRQPSPGSLSPPARRVRTAYRPLL